MTRPGHPEAAASALAADDELDLALVMVDDGRRPDAWAAFAHDGSTRLGEPAVAFGFPLSGMGMVSPAGMLTTGVVSGLSGADGDASRLQLDINIYDGSSGSPILDRAGNVIAIASAVLTDYQDIVFGVRAEVARSFLRANGVEPRAGAAGELETPDIAAEAARFTAIIDCLR